MTDFIHMDESAGQESKNLLWFAILNLNHSWMFSSDISKRTSFNFWNHRTLELKGNLEIILIQPLHLRQEETGFPGGASDKESACWCRRRKRCGFDPWVRKMSWSRKWLPLQYSCLENPINRGEHKSPWGHKEVDTTEWLSAHKKNRRQKCRKGEWSGSQYS